MADTFENIGSIADRVVAAAGANSALDHERNYDGGVITKPGIYRNVDIEDYHHKLDLLDGISVSKSSIKYAGPEGSLKEFWWRWAFNPDHIEPKLTPSLHLGKAVHTALLENGTFEELYAIRPDQFKNWATNASKEWRAEQEANGKTAITPEDVIKIGHMHKDAAELEIIKDGALNGPTERSIFWKDELTGIWLKVRPDVISANGFYADLKTVGKMNQDFIEKQISDCGYYLQGAMIRKACRVLDLPFETFFNIYTSTADTPDTAFAEMSVHELDRGERVIEVCLLKIKHGIDSGEWPGADICNGGGTSIQMKPWAKTQIDNWLEKNETPAMETAA